ncbi:HNH endonuclease, partial [Parabacteroides goldsteinii]
DQIKLLIYSFGDTVFYNDNKTEIEERTQYYIQLKKEESEKEKKSVEEREKEEIKQRIIDRQRKRQIEKIITQELINEGTLFPEANKRPPIPKEVVDTVWNRDTGKCVYCGSTENLHLDHIIPFSKGGATNVENLQLLCQKCNLEKSNKIG